jgi:predicted anti-sigma-YlaC factor YlaD
VDIFVRLREASCADTRERLSDHLDGELTGRAERRVARHLARCERCREALRSLARAVESLESLGRVTLAVPGPPLADSVVERIRLGAS